MFKFKDWLHVAAFMVSRNAAFYQYFKENINETPEGHVEAYSAIAQKLACYQEIWKHHPDYYAHRNAHDMGVVWVFQHPPAPTGRTLSYGIGDLFDEDAIRWFMKRGDWELIDCLPVHPSIPFSAKHSLLLPFDYSKRAAGFHNRMELKRLLPEHLKPLISKLRRSRMKRKVEYLSMSHKRYGYVANESAYQQMLRDETQRPSWYNASTKRDLWVSYIETNYYNESKWLLQYVDSLENFHDMIFGIMDIREFNKHFIRIAKGVNAPKQKSFMEML